MIFISFLSNFPPISKSLWHRQFFIVPSLLTFHPLLLCLNNHTSFTLITIHSLLTQVIRAFLAITPKLCHELALNIPLSHSISSLKSFLKTHTYFIVAHTIHSSFIYFSFSGFISLFLCLIKNKCSGGRWASNPE